jgi:hypothetical protein
VCHRLLTLRRHSGVLICWEHRYVTRVPVAVAHELIYKEHRYVTRVPLAVAHIDVSLIGVIDLGTVLDCECRYSYLPRKYIHFRSCC